MTSNPPPKKTENKKFQPGAGDIVNDFIEDVWKVMTPAMIERLKRILTEDLGLSKSDTEKFIQCQRDIRRQRICLKKTTREVRIGPRNQWIKELSKDIADQIAKFIVGILLSDRNDKTKKLTEQILDRLCEVTGESTTIESAKTRVERTLVIVADRLATWINENITDIQVQLKEKLSGSLATSSASTFKTQESFGSLTSCDTQSEGMSDLSEDRRRFQDSLVTFDSDVESIEGKKELSDEESGEESSGRSDKDSEDESVKSATEESSVQESEEESSDVEVEEEEEGIEEEGEEEKSEESDEDEDDAEEESVEAESIESEAEEEAEQEEAEEEEVQAEESAEESVAMETQEGDISEHPSVSSESYQPQSKSEITSSAVSPMDILDLLREDFERIPKELNKSDRQQAMKEVIDNRLKKIAQEKLARSLDSIVKYDIDETASIVANWVEKILSAADDTEALPTDTEPKQGSAFEIMRGDGSQLEVHKLSSMTVAKQVAELRGLEPPLRKKRIPRTMSPINIKSMNDWADWAIGAVNVGREWDKWLDETLEDVENQLVKERDSKSKEERHEAWEEWKEKKAKEATKWRTEKRRIKAEGALWNRKLENEQPRKTEQETRSHTF